jgi:hypothetical protein
MDVQVNTTELDPGDYQLMVMQPDGKPRPVPIAILPSPPKLEGAPFPAYQGEATRDITLRGERLNLIAHMKSPGAEVTLTPASPDGTERKATIHLDPKASAGQAFDLTVFVENRSEPLTIAPGIRVSGPRPKITESRLSLPPEVAVGLMPAELPSRYFLSAMLSVSNMGTENTVDLRCRGDRESRLLLHAGAKSAAGSMDVLGPNQLFLTFDDSGFPNGCEVLASVESTDAEAEGYSIGRILRVPKIQSLETQSLETTEPSAGAGELTGALKATLTGQDLETIERTGWDATTGTAVTELPSPIPGEGQKQILRITLPLPGAPDAPLYVWLRGEATGRATTIHAPAQAKPKPGLAAKTEGQSSK